MKRITIASLLLAAALVVPAQAARPATPGSNGHGHQHGHHCKAHKTHKVGFVVEGTFAGPAANTGPYTLTVTHANRHARNSGVTVGSPYQFDAPANTEFNGVTDKNADGVGYDDLTVGTDVVKLVGKVERTRKPNHGCPGAAGRHESKFDYGDVTLRKAVVNPPEEQQPAS